MASHVPQLLREHQTVGGSQRVPSAVNRERLRSLEFSNAKVMRSVHTGGVAALDLDGIEQRYLLAGAGDASLAIYDTQQPSTDEQQATQERAREAAGVAAALGANARALRPSGQAATARSNAEHSEHAALLSVSKQHPQAHKYSVSTVAWYPVDTGLFVSGGYDHEVKVWDTNTQAVVCSFSLPARVHVAAMSAVATAHCLVGVGSGDTQVMLCDIVSGGFTHTLSGHRAAVWAVAWSRSNEWQLVTGVAPTPDGLHWLSAGTDDRVRLWDGVSYTHELVHYQGAFNRANRARQLAVSDDSSTLFHPSGSVVQMYDIGSGKLERTLRGHFDTVNCCTWNPAAQELYTGSDDCNIVVWAPAQEGITAEHDEGQGPDSDGDAWSD